MERILAFHYKRTRMNKYLAVRSNSKTSSKIPILLQKDAPIWSYVFNYSDVLSI